MFVWCSFRFGEELQFGLWDGRVKFYPSCVNLLICFFEKSPLSESSMSRKFC